jgi:hypothetical protein
MEIIAATIRTLSISSYKVPQKKSQKDLSFRLEKIFLPYISALLFAFSVERPYLGLE